MRNQKFRELTLFGEDFDNAAAGTTGDILVYLRDESEKILLASGTDVPTDATTGYAKGCIFIDRNVATASTGTYVNVGTSTSCAFVAPSHVTSGDVTISVAGVTAVATVGSATAAEIGRACDVSTRKVSLTATASITEATHEGKTCVITGTAAATYTLPEATGSGAIYKFIMNQVNTNGTVFKTADTTNCSFFGSVNILDLDAAAQAGYAPAATDDLMTLNGTTTGGAIGDYIQFIDMATDKWCVFGQLQCPTGSDPATPFSGTA